ncbi:hypothetical protein GTP23_16865 [Pseudoduganella sp. FT93W]|uniref:DUF1311 domain-containing protein n=1 Tax=Duganella fentianensis TaxID=2692177 RepID=A0A845I471_9BURK|nr:hypothetical protein [Duganella fentianensis]MYN46721.1 hypothetical protein [Duganella fentianensis]
MMRVIRNLIGVLLGMVTLCHAATDPECLKHLGGAFGDVECFNGLSIELKKENQVLVKEISASIPSGNKNRNLVKDYLRHQEKGRDFCELSRQSLTNWKREVKAKNPRYYDYDVAYYECLYLLVEQENRFLKNLSKNVDQR